MKQAEKERKKFYTQILLILDSGKKIQKKIEKKSKIKKTSFRHYFSPKRDEIGRERQKKKIQTRIPFILDPGKKMPKKIQKKKSENLKTPFRHYFQPKWDEIGREREKKNLDLNSVHTRPGQENSKKIAKKFKKLKNPFLTLFLAKMG